MDKYEQFKEYASICFEKFKDIDNNETIRLVSHLDADGISAAAIMIKTLNSDNRKYSISIVQQLKEDFIMELARETYNVYVFTDLGSGQLNAIKKHLGGKKIFILDHHEPEEELRITKDIVHLNPHLFDIDGSTEISGAGVVYQFCQNLNDSISDFSHIAIVGAIGDIQEKNGFSKLNNDILETAIRCNKIKVIKGLRIFGAQTKPLHKVLQYTSEPFIPGVSGSESGAIQFLNELGINPRNEKGWKKLVHLNDEEMKKLVAGIVMKRLGEGNPEDIIGNVYILKEEEKESPLRDVKEYATLLNACGRLGKASLGIGTCLGDKKTKQRAISSLADYKKEIVNAINWYNENKETSIKGEGYLIINTKDNIMPTIAGTLASIVSKSGEYDEGTFVMSLAQIGDGTTKVSLRISGNNGKEIDLRDVLKKVSKNIENCEFGGHIHASGAMILTENEEDFIINAEQVLRSYAVEEVVR